jgi:histidyl-tRNA synthetase
MKLFKLEWLSEEFKTSFKKFWDYLCILKCDSKVKIDFTLARGLDYYTGIIFEVQLKKGKIGSIAAGGRYDKLCNGIDCVGFSMGVDRVTSVVKQMPKRKQNVDVKVVSVDSTEDVFRYKLFLLEKLRSSGIKCGCEMSLDSNLGTQITKALKSDIPYLIFIGSDECQNNTVTLKTLDKKEQKQMSLESAIKKIKGIQ